MGKNFKPRLGSKLQEEGQPARGVLVGAYALDGVGRGEAEEGVVLRSLRRCCGRRKDVLGVDLGFGVGSGLDREEKGVVLVPFVAAEAAEVAEWKNSSNVPTAMEKASTRWTKVWERAAREDW